MCAKKMPWAIMLGCLLPLLKNIFCYDVHVSESESPGYSIFNASIGNGWTYRLRATYNHDSSALSLDSYSAVLYSSKYLTCSPFEHNPIKFKIIAKNEELLTDIRIPITLYIHGTTCPTSFKHMRRKLELLQFPGVDTILIKSSVKSRKELCFEKEDNLMTVSDVLPRIFLDQCEVTYNVEDKISPIHIDRITGRITLSEAYCFTKSKIMIFVHMTSNCANFHAENPNLVRITLDIDSQENAHLESVRRRRNVNAAPKFDQRQYTLSAPENQNVPFVVDTIIAKDEDSGPEGSLRYSLIATGDVRSQTMFDIDNISGQIRTTQILDRENIDVHYFSITAVDESEHPLSAMATVKIFVDDINDHRPEFESDIYTGSIQESTGVGSTVYTVKAVDGDTGHNAEITYTLLNPTGNNAVFRIEPELGNIVTRSELDRERVHSYSLLVQAADNAAEGEKLTATATVELTLLDENDNKPQFTKRSYSFNVSEDIDPSGSPVIAEIHATDADSGENSQIRYSIIAGNRNSTFAIGSINGQLSLLRHVDFEQDPAGFQLTVRAQDDGSPPRSNTTNVLIRLIDVNDNAPRFYTTQYYESVSEDIDVGHNIIYVNAFDRDSGENGRITFSIEDAPEDMPIQIDPGIGKISTNGSLDRETVSRYNFNVVASDHGSPPKSATAAVEITVRDVNDNSPVFTPDEYHYVVSENDQPGTPVINVMASDSDENGRLTYAITSGNNNNAFNIISQMGTGLITTARRLDYREHNRYILTVTATDTGGLLDTATVYINVSDANTHRPEFQNTPYIANVNEDAAVGSTVISIVASDRDVGLNAQIQYTMASSRMFSIDPSTGDITIKQALDRETTPGYTLTVTATDLGRPPQSDTTDVEIVVQDVNDNSPVFSAQEYSGQVDEDAKEDTSVLTIQATDADVGMNGHIHYTFEGGDDGDGDFQLGLNDGILRTLRELDRERVPVYHLIAFAVDRGAPAKSTSIRITIEVQDINDNAPRFESSKMHAYIDENSPIGSTVESIRALDPDEGANAEIKYILLEQSDYASFNLLERPNEQLAIITTGIELNYEGTRNEYTIELRATSKHLFSDVKIVIHVQDKNDNPPELEDFTIIVNNFPDHFPSGEIGSIPAYDPDENDDLRYRILSGNSANLLHLDSDTGALRLDARLNSDVPKNGTMRVLATDGINEVRATARLFVRLVTEDMLFNSITVRLRGVDAPTFLSPLYDRFVTALAVAIPTTADNVFIVNVEEDTGVPAPDKVLNVSFSVRKGMDGLNDVFYSQELLRERVYMQRSLLNTLSTLEVLPFSDNLCILEPCLNFDQCITGLKFGKVMPFIQSDTMLFRPIHPKLKHGCTCPAGFTGMQQEQMCDTEVNLCYSNPCGGNGTCVQREGGYTCLCHEGYAGAQCNVHLVSTHYDACLEDICRPPSECVPLIVGGFRCEVCTQEDDTQKCDECAKMAYHTEFCELTTRSFSTGDFLMFNALKARHRFKVKLSFATSQLNALLFYNGRYNEKHDFIALEIVNGQIQFSFSLGKEIHTVNPRVEGGVSNGEWQTVSVHYLNRTATVTVGEACDTEISIRYGRSMDPPYLCADRATHVLEADCLESPTRICNRLLDLTGPFMIGGVPQLPTDFQMQNQNFAGCVRDVFLDEAYLDLNSFVWNNNTEKGCEQKQEHCASNPCQNEGTCTEAWNSYSCACTDTWGGKDCSQKIESPWTLDGNGYLEFGPGPDVTFPWYNSIMFRTRDETALLMQIEVGTRKINVELVGGLIHYLDGDTSAVLDTRQVNDARWHHLQVRWLGDNTLIISLDYGQDSKTFDAGDWLVGEPLKSVVVGGQKEQRNGETVVLNALTGCVKDIRVGNGENAILRGPEVHQATSGCQLDSLCRDSECGNNAECVGDKCTCKPGYFGSRCDPVCTRYNPCSPDSECVTNSSAPNKYSCRCHMGRSGPYCEVEEQTTCPSTWWGEELCGPCDCPRDKGFNPSCDKRTGECSCKENHYQPKGSDRCLRCDCYAIGTQDASQSCDPVTGQCPCHHNVVGRKCDACASKFGEVTVQGCEVQYDKCPRQFAGGMWWASVSLGATRWQPCPGTGTIGNASRTCGERGWKEPDMFNCTSQPFAALARKVSQLDAGTLQLTTFVARGMAWDVRNATNETEYLYGSDVMIANQIILHMLRYENRQNGLNLTHTQERSYIQNIVSAVGRITGAETKSAWREMSRRQPHLSAASLLRELETYVNTLAVNLHQLFTQPFDAVHDNLLLGLDTILKENMTNVGIPKYNNKVAPAALWDRQTNVRLPAAKLFQQPSDSDDEDEILSNNRPVVAVGYLLFRHLGDLLGHQHTPSIDVPSDIPLSLNSPVLSLSVVDQGQTLTSGLQAPIMLEYKLLAKENRTSPFCVYWEYGDMPWSGQWSDEGCSVTEEYEQDGDRYVTCSCDHMTSFGVLMAVYDRPLPGTQAHTVHVITYIGLLIALLCFLFAFLTFCLMRGIDSNANSIHINLAFVLIVANLVYLAGINRVKPQLGCKFVTIFLHYFYLSSFSWLFVEVLHLYRMITEIRNINHGAMKFYYMLGYVVPGIVVCLAVGLQTEGYGENGTFCWFETDVLLLWSFAAPVAISVAMDVVVFVLAMRASCQGKAVEPEHSYQRYGLWVILVLLPIFSLTWIFGVVGLNENMTALHYLFAIFTAAEGIALVLGYIVLSKQTRHDLRYTLQKLQGKKSLDESLSAGGTTRASMMSRSALAYHHNDSSLDGGLRAMTKGISTATSSTSTSKSRGYVSRDSSNAASIGRVKNKSKERVKRGIPGDSDSDSEISAMEHPDLDLASSHSSDDEDDVAYPPWRQSVRPGSNQGPPVTKPRPVATVLPSTSATTVSSSAPVQPIHQSTHGTPQPLPTNQGMYNGPPSYQQLTSQPSSPKRTVKWAGDHQVAADMPPRSPEQVHLKMAPLHSRDPSLQEPPYNGHHSPDPHEASGIASDSSQMRRKLAELHTASPSSPRRHMTPASPRDRIILASQHGGSSMTSESEYV